MTELQTNPRLLDETPTAEKYLRDKKSESRQVCGSDYQLLLVYEPIPALKIRNYQPERIMIEKRHALSLIETTHKCSLPTEQKGRLVDESGTGKSAVIGCSPSNREPDEGGVELGQWMWSVGLSYLDVKTISWGHLGHNNISKRYYRREANVKMRA